MSALIRRRLPQKDLRSLLDHGRDVKTPCKAMHWISFTPDAV